MSVHVLTTDLVVDHNVDGAVRRVVGKVTQVERLVDDALTGKCRITVNQHAHNLTDTATFLSGHAQQLTM